MPTWFTGAFVAARIARSAKFSPRNSQMLPVRVRSAASSRAREAAGTESLVGRVNIWKPSGLPGWRASRRPVRRSRGRNANAAPTLLRRCASACRPRSQRHASRSQVPRQDMTPVASLRRVISGEVDDSTRRRAEYSSDASTTVSYPGRGLSPNGRRPGRNGRRASANRNGIDDARRWNVGRR